MGISTQLTPREDVLKSIEILNLGGSMLQPWTASMITALPLPEGWLIEERQSLGDLWELKETIILALI